MDKKYILVKDTRRAGADQTEHFAGLLAAKIQAGPAADSVQVVRAADIGFYDQGLVLKFLPAGPVYLNVSEADLDRVVSETVLGGRVLEDLAAAGTARQLRVVLRNCGVINPESLEEYIRRDGYRALSQALFEYTPEKVIEEFKKSGLRGRGGAGYPTWLKWHLTRSVPGDEKYVICNADEGDPGAYMDRSILEGDPHSVLEGMIIAGYAIGAGRGYFYIRAEYPLAIERIGKAIGQARERGLLGAGILGSNFNFEVDIRLGAGAFVCGEETALIASIEGKRGTPRPRPPYPSVSGLWGKPTSINNVETFANVPVVMTRGGDWFAGIGTEKSRGTKVFAVTGKVKNSGLVEVPMGVTLRQIVFDIGGGVRSGKKIKAVQTGGPSGGVIPESRLDTPVDYENLQKLGSIMGSGGMIVMDEDDCMVDIAKFYLGFCVEESCGKCAPCRIGTYQLLKILERISEGEGRSEDLDQMRLIAQAMQKASLCGLGQTASNPVLSTLNYFENEYREHIQAKRCRSFKCRDLLTYSIIQSKCKRCRQCFLNCPVQAISGDREVGFYIQLDKCTKCGKCFEVCKFNAIARE